MIAIAATFLTAAFPWRTLRSPDGLPFYDVAFSPDGTILAATGFGDVITLWNVHSGSLIKELPYSEKPAWFGATQLTSSTGAISADARREEGDWRFRRAIIIETASGKELVSLLPHPDQLNSIAISPDGKVFATGGGYTDHPWPVNPAGDARLWDARTGKRLATLKRHWGAVSCVRFSPDGKTLATASYDGTIKLWGLKTLLGR